MASSLISSSHHIDFDSVFGIDDTVLVQMFETLIATGLKEFWGCPAVFYEAALTEFFENSSVRDGVVVSTIRGTAIEISENFFSMTFGLPTDGLTDFLEAPKDLVFYARSLFSVSKEQVSISCLKKEMKIQYRLLSDILAKTLYVKAGSFDAVTRDRFMLMTAITFDVKVNWSSLIFCVLQDIVTPGSRQAKGFAIQICVLLKNVPGLVLGESRAFPASRVLTKKTIHRYVTINEKVGMEETADAPMVKKTPAKKTVSTKRPVGDEALITLIQGARQEGRTIDDVQTLRFNEFRKGVLANNASVAADLMDVKKALREINAKVDVVSARLDDVKKDVEATKEAISHQLLDFQAQAQANHNIITGLLRELVNYINRGGNDKKGEGSSRGPQPPPDNKNRESGNAGGDAARSIVERLISADRERERSRGNRTGSYKRRRY
ncbi:hypothetical protein F511_31275 [Dorcoceras hygrometricum]|uniref:Dystroglycan-like n=1 Tax=Dorcoceras hygrometricum TaxID=472368 RepID=A0A2Z7B7Z6_9LAMI|nr:hypothetical protein F511_31275 [Dorcoceras hygrometricum]